MKELSPTKVVVEDISGGCGSMYNVNVESPLFAVGSVFDKRKAPS